MSIEIKKLSQVPPKAIFKDIRDNKYYKPVDIIKMKIDNIIFEKLQIIEIDFPNLKPLVNGNKLLISEKSLNTNFKHIDYYD